MIYSAEVVDTKKAFNKNQKDDKGNTLPLGTIKVRLFKSSTMGNVNDVYAAPLSLNTIQIPLVGEFVYILKGPAYDRTSPDALNTVHYYLPIPLNLSDDVVINQLPNSTQRNTTKKSNRGTTSAIKPGKTFPFPPRPIGPIQVFEGDYIVQGRGGSSLRFTVTQGNGGNLYENKPTWSGGKSGDPLMMLRIKAPGKPQKLPHFKGLAPSGTGPKPKTRSQNFDVENFVSDATTIAFTTSQKLPTLIPARLCGLASIISIPRFNNTPQGVFDSGRLVFNAKKDNLFLLAKKQAVTNAKEIFLITNEHKVNFDKLVNIVQDLSKQLHRLTSAQAVFTTVAGPTGIATNILECLSIWIRARSLNVPCIQIPTSVPVSKKVFKLGATNTELDIPKKQTTNSSQKGTTQGGGASLTSGEGTGGGGGGGGSSSGGGSGGGSSSGGGESSGGNSGGGSGGGDSSSGGGGGSSSGGGSGGGSSSGGGGGGSSSSGGGGGGGSSTPTVTVVPQVVEQGSKEEHVTPTEEECWGFLYELKMTVSSTYSGVNQEQSIYLVLVTLDRCEKGWYALGSFNISIEEVPKDSMQSIEFNIHSDNECLVRNVQTKVYKSLFTVIDYKLINLKKRVKLVG